MSQLIDFVVEWDFVDVLNKVDPLVDRGCKVLDGHCDCEWKEGQSVPDGCKYLGASDG